jgi:hypothetical protein
MMGMAMPISDAYVVQYLLQETCAHRNPLLWSEKNAEEFSANLHGVDVELYSLRDRGGARLYLTLLAYPERIDLSEPVNKGFLGENYDSVDEADMAHWLRELLRRAARQCAARSQRTPEAVEVIREHIYRRLIGADEGGGLRAEGEAPITG